MKRHREDEEDGREEERGEKQGVRRSEGWKGRRGCEEEGYKDDGAGRRGKRMSEGGGE